MKAAMKYVVLAVMAMAVTACSVLPASLGGVSNQLQSIIAVTVAGKYDVTVRKNGVTLVVETWECTTDGTKLTGCHKIASQSAPAVSADPVVVPPVK